MSCLLSNGYSFGQDGMCSCLSSPGRSANLGEKSHRFCQKYDCASAECVSNWNTLVTGCTWCGYKITGLVLEHLLFKNLHNRNVTFNVLPPRSLYRSMRIFHCWKQCCKSSSDSLFMSSVAFAFTESADSNLVPFNADLIFGNKKKVTWG